MNTCRPPSFGVNASGFGDILKLERPLVSVECCVGHVAGKKEVGPTIPVHISEGHTGTIIKIFEGDDIQIRTWKELVGKSNTRLSGRVEVKQGVGIGPGLTSQQQEKEGDQAYTHKTLFIKGKYCLLPEG
jgi:hypothetical protein